ERHGARVHLGDAARADQQVGRHAEHGNAEQAQILRFPSDQRADRFHRRQRVVGRQREERTVGNALGEVHPVPPTVSPSILSVGWPTPTGTLWPSLPQVPMPGSSARSLPIIDTRVSASGPLPISVAPLTGCVTLPFSIR